MLISTFREKASTFSWYQISNEYIKFTLEDIHRFMHGRLENKLDVLHNIIRSSHR